MTSLSEKFSKGSDDRTVPVRLEEVICRHARSVAYIFEGRRISFRKLGKLIDACADGLRGLGVGRGDRVVICLPNIPQTPIAIQAVHRVGAVAVMSNPLNSVHEIAMQLRDSQAKVTMVMDSMVGRMSEARAELDCVIVGCDPYQFLPAWKRLATRLRRRAQTTTAFAANVVDFRRLLQNGGREKADYADLDDLALVLYTGGTTGKSKGVMVTHRNLLANVSQIGLWASSFDDQQLRVLGVFPFFTGAGFTALMTYTALRGGTVILLPRPDAVSLLKVMRRYRPNVLPAVPTIYAGMLGAPGFEESGASTTTSLRLCISGAAPLPIDIQERWKEITGLDIVQLYGMSETTAMTHGNPAAGPVRPGSVGLPLDGTDTRIVVSDTDHGLENGEVGEIVVRGPQIVSGYLNRPDETAQVLRDGWLFTGDLGRVDETGYLYIVGRRKEMVISSGYNVYLNQVDDVLRLHPSVADVGCVGVADAYRGEIVRAYVVPKASSTARAEDLDTHCRNLLAVYKVPTEYVYVSSLPRNALGKVLRHQLTAAEGAVIRVRDPAGGKADISAARDGRAVRESQAEAAVSVKTPAARV